MSEEQLEIPQSATHESVKHEYATVILKGGDDPFQLADRAVGLGYDAEFLERCGLDLAQGSSLFSALCGCGCPLRLENAPRTGETVVDLGCGAGHDVVLASRLVGSQGRVVGVDLCQEMIEAAERNVEEYKCDNVKLVCAAMDNPGDALESNMADVAISNGSINLCADKRAAFETVFRILKNGGRFLLADICLVEEHSPEAVSSVVGDSWSNCVTGCLAVEHYVNLLRGAGFHDVKVVGMTDFWTSESTRGVNFTAVKP